MASNTLALVLHLLKPRPLPVAPPFMCKIIEDKLVWERRSLTAEAPPTYDPAAGEAGDTSEPPNAPQTPAFFHLHWRWRSSSRTSTTSSNQFMMSVLRLRTHLPVRFQRASRTSSSGHFRSFPGMKSSRKKQKCLRRTEMFIHRLQTDQLPDGSDKKVESSLKPD